jgi:hypothetical protein
MVLSVVSGFRHEVDKNCPVLGYAASNINFLLKSRDKLWAPSSRVALDKGADWLSRNVGKELPLYAA